MIHHRGTENTEDGFRGEISVNSINLRLAVFYGNVDGRKAEGNQQLNISLEVD